MVSWKVQYCYNRRRKQNRMGKPLESQNYRRSLCRQEMPAMMCLVWACGPAPTRLPLWTSAWARVTSHSHFKETPLPVKFSGIQGGSLPLQENPCLRVNCFWRKENHKICTGNVSSFREREGGGDREREDPWHVTWRAEKGPQIPTPFLLV